MMATRFGALTLLLSLCSLSLACTVHHDDGQLALGWTVTGAATATECGTNGAAQIQITVLDDNGSIAGSYVAACTALHDTIALPAGDYTASVVLLDTTGAARTSPVTLDPFVIYSDAAYDFSIDFPSSSFLAN